jgi:hypothetical protein
MRSLRFALLLSSAVSISTVFGVADRVVQGHSAAGWYLANVAGVWLAVAFAFGAVACSRHEAWVAGLFAEMSALAGYYGWMRLAQHQWQPIDHPLFWSFCGLLAGPVFGLVGYSWRRHRSEIAGATLGVAFVFEAVALALAQQRPRGVVELETVAGLMLAVLLLAGARWRKRHPPTT